MVTQVGTWMDRHMSRCPTGCETLPGPKAYVLLLLSSNPQNFPCVQLDLQLSLCPSVLHGHAPVTVSVHVSLPSLPWGAGGGLRGQSRGQVLSWTHGQGHIPLVWGVLQPLSPSSGGRQGDKAGASAVPLGPPQQGQTRMNTWPLRPPTPLPAAGLGGPLWVCPLRPQSPGGAGQAPIPHLHPAAPSRLFLPSKSISLASMGVRR